MQRQFHAFSPLHSISAGIRRRTGIAARVSLFAIAGLAGAITLQDPPGPPPTAEVGDPPSEPYVVPADALLVIAYHENGLRKREAIYDDGRPEGLWVGWGEDGGLSFQGHYRRGLRHGIWQIYDRSSGALLRESSYEDGTLHGPWTAFDSGYIVGTGTYENGRRTGVWTTYGVGYIEETGTYEDDRRTGAWTFWHGRDRKSAEGGYENGVKAGDWTYWDESGEIDKERTGAYQDGRLTKSRRRRTP
jgi:antitoxin component YwqK of YwqJK toxin-antitoxin module